MSKLSDARAADHQAELTRLREENERLKAATSRPEAVLYWMDRAEAAVARTLEQHQIVQDLGREIRALETELAAARARERVLREALQRYVDDDAPCEYGGDVPECPGFPSFAPCRLHQAKAALRSKSPRPENKRSKLRVRLVAGSGQEAQDEETADFSPEEPKHGSTCGDSRGPDPLCGGCR